MLASPCCTSDTPGLFTGSAACSCVTRTRRRMLRRRRSWRHTRRSFAAASRGSPAHGSPRSPATNAVAGFAIACAIRSQQGKGHSPRSTLRAPIHQSACRILRWRRPSRLSPTGNERRWCSTMRSVFAHVKSVLPSVCRCRRSRRFCSARAASCECDSSLCPGRWRFPWVCATRSFRPFPVSPNLPRGRARQQRVQRERDCSQSWPARPPRQRSPPRLSRSLRQARQRWSAPSGRVTPVRFRP